MEKKKLSIDFSGDTYSIVQKSQDKYYENFKKKLSVGKLVNDAIRFTFGLDNDIKEQLIPLLAELMNNYQREKALANLNDQAFATQKYDKLAQELQGLILLLNSYKLLESSDNSYTEYQMSGNKCLRCPSQWVALNEQDSLESEYAYAVECRNSATYRIPTFIFFSNVYNEEKAYNLAIQLCVEKVPYFQGIIDNQIQPEYSTENQKAVINADKFILAPHIGVYRIETQREVEEQREVLINYTPPAGAIVLFKK